ncbi:UNVERIFIED_CONTAM: Retrovirus-related Pol polyprotein from type-2 retrotransposable element R2DM [Sesamum indicum]
METEKSPMNENGLEKMTGEYTYWNRTGDDKENNLVGKTADLAACSSTSKLGLRADGEEEKTPMEDESTPNRLGMADDRFERSEDRETMPTKKDSKLAVNDGELVRRPKLGFGGAPLMNNNGGRQPGTFNMGEFIRLARTVIDAGDFESLKALEDLQTKWKTRFGKENDTNRFPAPEPITEPPLVRGIRKAIRNIHPPATRIQTQETTTDGVSLSGFRFFGEIVDRTDMEMRNRHVILGSGTVPTRTADLRPMTEGENAIPVKLTFADAVADVSPEYPADVSADLAADVTSADMGHDTISAMEKNGNIGRKIVPVQLFIGNIPLNTNSKGIVDDKIADAFNNSSRKTLNYIAPTRQNGEIILRPSLELYEMGQNDGKLRQRTVAIPGTTDSFAKMGTWYGYEKIEAYTSANMDKTETPSYGILDDGRIEYCSEWCGHANHIIIMTPDEEGGETPCKIDIEYEWLPPKCTGCLTLGHSVKDCSMKKTQKHTKPPVKVYVHKSSVPPPPKPKKQQKKHDFVVEVDKVPKKNHGVEQEERETSSHKEKVWNVRGLNKRDHQLAVKDLVSEYRTDSESFIITVVYGASEMIDRRNLWTILETLAREHSDEPWLVGGDFNAVREMNEVCGISGDIRMAMEEFNAGIQEAGLIPLPMQGEREQRRKKGDLTLNVQLARGFLDEAQDLVRYDRQNEVLLQLEHCCQIVYAKAVKQEQIILQQRAKMQWMKGGDQCSRIFFRKIAQRRVARRILQINDDNGTIHTETGEIINEFVSYYKDLLGGNRRQTTMDIGFLRPWARHVLSNEETNYLISAFTPDDVKNAVFDIAEDKAPGPDGYSSSFFKAAWPVVGQEVTKAILEFFSSSKLLKQVNATLLTLIPKVHTPMTVGDFRPISCCNVLYKIIAKLLVKRLSGELLTGYNQLIRKAYDTVEWDFLLAVMQLFGFPQMFTRWIGECVTTASFSIGLNGNPHDFFAGARGLRQGDPLSPYLFVLIMEKCEPTKILQLGFADDLLLFCKVDFDSLRVLKMGLDRFADWSGLRLNIHKSHVVISRSAQGWKDQILAVMGFQEGQLPMRYLGLPLQSSRLTINDCQSLLLKIDARINGWEGISLSYAGRIQIIKSVLSATSTYWASDFILPKTVIKQIEKRLRNFLWKGNYTLGYAKVAWKDVCKPHMEGGQGIKDIGILNRALMAKKLCDVIRCDRTSIWVEWLKHGRLRDNSIWTINEKGGSWGWRKILRLRRSILPMTEFIIGEGNSFFLWKDPWHHLGPLITRFPRGPRLLGLDKSAKLQVVIDEGQWQWPLITDLECIEIIYTLPQIHGGDDRINWRFSKERPTTQSLYRLFSPPGSKVGWYSLLSGSLKIPRHNFILWLAIQEKLPTTDKPWMNHLGGCILCDEGNAETHTHMFFRCRFSRRCLADIRQQVRFSWPNHEWARDVEWESRKWRGKHIVNIAYRALLGACIYHIWRERNLRRFERTPTTLSILITEDVRQRILSVNLAKSVSTRALYRLWRIPWPPTTQALYRLFDPLVPKVGWSLLLAGSLKIPRHSFILWLAILGKLPSMDKPWLSHLGVCILCDEGATESHSHLFFRCRYSRQCLLEIRRRIRFHWPNRDWTMDIEWATRKWRFEHTERTPATLSILITDDVKHRILSVNLPSSVSTRALYRLWRIPWVERETN